MFRGWQETDDREDMDESEEVIEAEGFEEVVEATEGSKEVIEVTEGSKEVIEVMEESEVLRR